MLRRAADAETGAADPVGAARSGFEHHARREVRTLRRVELWSVFRLAGGVFAALYLLGLLTFGLLWWIASNTGTTGNIESFLRDVGFKGFTFKGGQLFLGALLAGAVLAAAATLLTTVLAAMVNLISELTGGIQVVVVEGEAGNEVAVAAPVPVPARDGPPPVTAPARPAVDDLVGAAASGAGTSAARQSATNGAQSAAAGRWTQRASALLRGSSTGSHRP